jgi:hydrogenase-4 component B
VSGVTRPLCVALGAAIAAVGLAGTLGARGSLALPWLVPLGGLELVLDPLGGFFVALIGMVSLPVSLYSIGYAGGERRGSLAYLVFLAAMAIVPLAANVMTFALAWELMSLASYLLVVQEASPTGHDGERRSAAAADAGWTYAVMAHAGVACVLAGMIAMWVWTGSPRFADWAAAPVPLSPAARDVAFALLALGFAAKAGLVPLHLWLPLAHPAAPSPVSALMSGAMVKLGVYGLLRAGFDWLGAGPTWWGVVLLVAGTVSAVLGILQAMVDRDLKRLLAFSTIENVGIVVIGVGAGLLFQSVGLPALAVLALVAALYHAANHAAFKTLLFLGAGAVVRATGTRDMEAMGGLVRRMPWTAASFLLGAAAIAALPPLNGFVSEWLLFQALLQTVHVPHAGLNLVFVVGLAGLALTGGLAMACFVKAFGIAFLALPRSEAAAAATEASPSMRLGMALLAAACVLLGLGATAVVPALAAVARGLARTDAPVAFGNWLSLDVSDGFARLSTLAVAAALALAVLGPWLVLRAVAPSGARIHETWGCGRMLQTARMEYTATAFANPFKRIFDFFYRPVHTVEIDAHPASRLHVRSIRYRHQTRPVIDAALYRPFARGLSAAAARVRLIQSGNANVYLGYILAALVVMLVLL